MLSDVKFKFYISDRYDVSILHEPSVLGNGIGVHIGSVHRGLPCSIVRIPLSVAYLPIFGTDLLEGAMPSGNI